MRIYLVAGGSASGKSAFAGRLAEQLAKGTNPAEEQNFFYRQKWEQELEQRENRVFDENAPILYIATLADQGEESLKKVARHRELRKSGNYIVAECFSFQNLQECCVKRPEKAVDKNRNSEGRVPGDRSVRYPVILFDSLDGFTADVMFRSKGSEAEWMQNEAPALIAEKTLRELLGLEAVCDHLIVVSDHVYSDGILYDEFTSRYMEYTSAAEQLLAEQAEYVTEVVCGIPVLLKGNRDELSEIVDYHVVSLYEDSDAVS